MIGLALLSYIECYADFTSLVEQGYYNEAERAVYLPGRFVGQAVVELVFVLPAISFVVVPLTTWLIRTGRLTFRDTAVCHYRMVGAVACGMDLKPRNNPTVFVSRHFGIHGHSSAALRTANPCHGYLASSAPEARLNAASEASR
jgi:hypothetical protein